MIYVILGMHKSGTTLVSQILHHSGINMGENIDDEVSYDRGNKYEREATFSLNLEILGLKSDRFIHYAAPDTLSITEIQRVRMREIIRNCNEAYPHWGFKDPRTALTYPLWVSELPEHKLIVVYRSPGELWPRFCYKPVHHIYKNPYVAWRLVKRWCEHNSNILNYLQNTTMNFLALNYRKLLTMDTEFDRLQEFVGIELCDQRRQDLYRSRSDNYLLLDIATRIVEQQTGCNSEKIIEQFESLRQQR